MPYVLNAVSAGFSLCAAAICGGVLLSAALKFVDSGGPDREETIITALLGVVFTASVLGFINAIV